MGAFKETGCEIYGGGNPVLIAMSQETGVRH